MSDGFILLCMSIGAIILVLWVCSDSYRKLTCRDRSQGENEHQTTVDYHIRSQRLPPDQQTPSRKDRT